MVLYRALMDIGRAQVIPEFGHLPYVMGRATRKLSKRDPQSNLLIHRYRGMIPEGLLNYLALLGWSLSADRDVFSAAEMIEAFDVHDVNPNPASHFLGSKRAGLGLTSWMSKASIISAAEKTSRSALSDQPSRAR